MHPKPATSVEITQLLEKVRVGDRAAESRLVSLVYPELRKLAARFLRGERADHSFQPTDLVHEVYLKLSGGQTPEWQNRVHFFAAAAVAMRRVLVDHARKHNAAKHGGKQAKVEMHESFSVVETNADTILEIDRAMSELEAVDARMCRVVELRFFGGLTEEETAKVLGIAPVSVRREWSMAKAWLHERLSGDA